MKKWNVVVCAVLFTISAYGQKWNLTGVVSNPQGERLAGASVYIENSFIGTYSNSNGEYSLEKLQAGTYTVVCSYMGYTNVIKQILVQSNTVYDIVLSQKAITIEPVVLTAIKAKEQTPVAKINLSKQEIEQQYGTKDIPYVLEQTPSIVATSDNGTGMGYTGMRIRGTDMSRINITVNGIPLNDAESQTVFWVNMADFASSVEEVQIQRGVGTSTNGAASFGASVNFQTVDLQEKPHAQISSSVGSFGTFKQTMSAGTGILDSCLYFGVRVSRLDSDGWVERSFSQHSAAHLTGSYLKGSHRLTANVFLGKERTGISWEGLPDYMLSTNRRYNVTGLYYDDFGNEAFYDNETDNYWQNHYSLSYGGILSKHITFSLTTHATTGKGFYEQYKDNAKFSKYGIPTVLLSDTVVVINQRQYIFPDSTIKRSDLIRQKWLDNIFYGYTTGITYTKNNTEISLGNSYNIYKGNHFGKVIWVQMIPDFDKSYTWYDNDSEKRDVMVFVKVQQKLFSQLSIFADMQYRNILYTMVGIDDDFTPLHNNFSWNFVNPKVGLYYMLNKRNKVFISYAVANREPTRTDLKDAGKSAKQVTNETLYDTELGYTLTLQKLSTSINVYNMQYVNQLTLTGKLNDVGDPIMENVPDSYRRGIEWSVGARPVQEIAWNASLTLSRNKIHNYTEYSVNYTDTWDEEPKITELGTTDISYSPNVIASNSIMFYPDKSIYFGFTSKYIGAQFYDNTSDEQRKLPAYAIHNFILAYTKPIYKTSLTIQLMVNNILDTQYISNAYGWNWYEQNQEKSQSFYYPQAGINYMCKMSLRF
jgi:iron complex outermembrane receptor protein